MAGVRIALFLMSGNNDYQRLIETDCITAARRSASAVQVFSANMNHDTQEEQIRAVLSYPLQQRPTVCFVCPVRETSLRLVAREVAARGVGWVLLNRWSDHVLTLRQEFPALPIFTVTADQREIGRVQALQLKMLRPRGVEVVVIRGPLGTSSTQRRFNAMKEGLDPSSFHLVPVNSDWTSSGGARAMAEWLGILRGKSSDFVVAAQNDRMATGARRALLDSAMARERNCSLVPFLGVDGLPTHGQRLVTEGELTATVVVPSVARRAVDETLAMLDTGRAPPAELSAGVSSFPSLDDLARRVSKAAGAARNVPRGPSSSQRGGGTLGRGS